MVSPKSTEAVYSVVVPVYNSATTLHALHEAVTDAMSELGKPFELILVDDGSRDDSWKVIQSLANEDKRVGGVCLMRNFGQASATLAGLQRASGDFLITIDDDLQHPPREISKLVAAIDDDPELDVVFGVPRETKHAAWRRVASDLLNKGNQYVFRTTASFKLTSFRLLRRDVVRPLFEMNVPIVSPNALLCMVTTRMANVEVDHEARTTGSSGYTLSKLIQLAISRYLGFSVMPLRMIGIVGLLGVLLCIPLGAFMLYRYFSGQIGVPGWTTVVLLLLGSMGFNFLALGILGEYLQNVLLSVRHMPMYLVRKHIPASASDIEQTDNDAGQGNQQ